MSSNSANSIPPQPPEALQDSHALPTGERPGSREGLRRQISRFLREGLRAIKRARVRLGTGGVEILAAHDRVEGILKLQESQLLHQLARGRRTIVEIGSFRGRSTVLLALGSAECQGEVWAIDPHMPSPDAPWMPFNSTDLDAFRKNVREFGIERRVHEILSTSDQARTTWAGKGIDLLWIDGDHTFEGASRDLSNWTPLLNPGGVVAAHDYSKHWPSVQKAWDQFMAKSSCFVHSGRVKAIVWARKV